jgi:hypothetical protein
MPNPDKPEQKDKARRRLTQSRKERKGNLLSWFKYQ